MKKFSIGRLENYCFPEVVRNFISPYICFFSVCNIVHLLSLLFTRNRKMALIKRLFNKRLNNCNWMPLLMKSNYKARFAFFHLTIVCFCYSLHLGITQEVRTSKISTLLTSHPSCTSESIFDIPTSFPSTSI